MIQIRWHARGGQGAKTAAAIVAAAAIESGRFAQGFPEYGAERSGAPPPKKSKVGRRCTWKI
jgi:pyruvate ferredoxin oxidoreductase gamma subunit